MADILHEEIFSSLNYRVQSCPRVGGKLPPCPPSPTPLLKQWVKLEVGGGGSRPASYAYDIRILQNREG